MPTYDPQAAHPALWFLGDSAGKALTDWLLEGLPRNMPIIERRFDLLFTTLTMGGGTQQKQWSSNTRGILLYVNASALDSASSGVDLRAIEGSFRNSANVPYVDQTALANWCGDAKQPGRLLVPLQVSPQEPMIAEVTNLLPATDVSRLHLCFGVLVPRQTS